MRETWDSEHDPLVALRGGDAGPFEAFVTSETATFLGFFLRLGASRPEAEDLVQDLFMKRLPPEVALYNDYHAQIVTLGRDVCRPRPRCGACPLDGICTRRGVDTARSD